ncbi:MAG: S28 family serine protease [Bacteroidota bacterium]
MMKSIQKLIFIFILLPLISLAQDSELYKFLKSIPGAEVVKKDSSAYKEFYIVMLPQAVNHADPAGPTFKQRIFVGHEGFDRPTVMETEGYGAEWVTPRGRTEVTKLLHGNQLYVEHRYFGPSTPDPLDWKYLTSEQDAGDYHYIRTLFGQVYKGKWVATGVSKGGQTATEYKVFYPDDVDVTIPYVAPINYERLDTRIDEHFNKVGTRKQRKHIKNIQLYLFQNKPNVLAYWQKLAEKDEFKFTSIDQESAFDYSVLEYPFSFWQYTADAATLPDLRSTTPDKMAAYLYRIVSPYWYTDAAKAYEAAGYQFYTQLGYYEYDERPFSKYLKNKDYPNSVMAPTGVSIVWDPSYQQKLRKFIEGKPQHMIYIYGESDPWGATAADIKPGSGSIKMVQSGGTHGAQISTLSPAQRKTVIAALEKWLEMKIE